MKKRYFYLNSLARYWLVSWLLLLLPFLARAGQLNAQVTEGAYNYLTLTAPAGTVFTSVDYADYGTSVDNGDGTYKMGGCHASNSQSIVEAAALNKNTFSILVNDDTFGDPCFGTPKSLAVVVTYTSPLPVVLTSFTVATKSGNAGILLTWATATELNSAHFEVQRSTTGNSFTPLGTVAARGNSTSLVSYVFTDSSLPAGVTTLYYRLRQVDTDGSATYSPVRSVGVVSGTTLALYPNPVQRVTTLTGVSAYSPVYVFTLAGGIVLTTTADGNGVAILTFLTQLPPGLYLVRAGIQATRLLVE